MSACSGRNYDFRCIHIVFGALLRECRRVQRLRDELILAQIRKKLPNGWTNWHQIWHTCADSSGKGYTPNKLPLETRGGGGHLGFFRGSTIKKSGEAVKQLDRLAPTLVHVCGFTWEWTWAFRGGGGLRGHTFKCLEKL